jgi:hypothetical protein
MSPLFLGPPYFFALLFDRNYAVPHLAVFVTLLVLTALIPVGFFVLSPRAG